MTELASMCLSDEEIARRISEETGWSIESINSTCRTLVKKGKIQKNSKRTDQKKLSEIEIETEIKRRRNALIGEGMTDRAISIIIAEDLGRRTNAVFYRILNLLRKGSIKRNTNKRVTRNYSDNDIEIIIRKRKKLISEGVADAEIARIISKVLKRSAGTVKLKIHNLIKSGKLPKNPNSPKWWTKAEEEKLIKERNRLLLEGLKDSQIAKKFADDFGLEKHSVDHKIYLLKKQKVLGENPNKRRNFSEQELELINRKRTEFISKGLCDNKIARELTRYVCRNNNVLYCKIRQLVKKGEFEENPHQQREMSAEVIDTLIKRRNELVSKGYCDSEITIKLAVELGLKQGTIKGKINFLIKKAILSPNENVRKLFSRKDLSQIIRKRNKLMERGINDVDIARRIAKDLRRTEGSIRSKLKNLVNDGKIPPNPNNQRRTPTQNGLIAGFFQSESELLDQLSDAVDMYLADGESR
jgi:hypothetical protein